MTVMPSEVGVSPPLDGYYREQCAFRMSEISPVLLSCTFVIYLLHT